MQDLLTNRYFYIPIYLKHFKQFLKVLSSSARVPDIARKQSPWVESNGDKVVDPAPDRKAKQVLIIVVHLKYLKSFCRFPVT